MRELTPKERAAMDRALRASAEIVPDPRDDRITELEAEVERLKDANMKLLTECDEQARGRGEAEGKLRASEMAGVVEGWKRRAEAAEAAWNTTETALRTLIDECTNETGEWSRMPRFWVIKKARAALKEDG